MLERLVLVLTLFAAGNLVGSAAQWRCRVRLLL